jgi:hypothetical protein
MGLEIRPQCAFTAFRALLPSVTTILLSDLVGCDSPLQIVMAGWRTFSHLKLAKRPFLSAEGCPPNLTSSNFKKSAPNGHYYLHCPLSTSHGVFSRAEKPVYF